MTYRKNLVEEIIKFKKMFINIHRGYKKYVSNIEIS